MSAQIQDEISQEQHLAFFKQLQEVTNRIHSTENIDEIMLEVSRDICSLCESVRLTLYAVSESKASIESKVKIGMNEFKDFKLPITDTSVAGFVALTKRTVNIKDVYDEAELKAISPTLRFENKVDERTGFRTKQMLAAPIVKADNGELLGVLQLINDSYDRPFSALTEEAVSELCKTLAIAFAQRRKPPAVIRSKFDPLVNLGFLAKTELILATRSARRKGLDLEDVLIDEFDVRVEALGYSYFRYFECPYEPFRENRTPSKLIGNFTREYVENNEWLILEFTPEAVTVLALDPASLEAARTVHNLFPHGEVKFRVTTRREFFKTVDQLYGVRERLPDQAEMLLERMQRIINHAFGNHAPDIQITLEAPEKPVVDKSEGSLLQSMEGQLIVRFRVDSHADDL